MYIEKEEDEGKSASGSTDSGELEEEEGEKEEGLEAGLTKSETVMLNVRTSCGEVGQDNQDTDSIQFQITLQEEDEDKDANTDM